MSDPAPHRRNHRNVTKAPDQLAKIITEFPHDPAQFVRSADLGTEMSFLAAEESIKTAIMLVDQLAGCDLNSLPSQPQSVLIGAIQECAQELNKLKGFNASASGNLNEARTNLINGLNRSLQKLFAATVPAFALDCRLRIDAVVESFRSNSEHQVEEIAKFKSDADAAVRALAAAGAAANQTLENMKKAAAELGVSKEAQRFEKEATFYEMESKTWLYRAIGVTVVTVGLVALFLFWTFTATNDESGKWLVLQKIGAKLLLMSLLLFALGFCVRNYSTSRHLATVNRHRANALSVFEIFIAGAASRSTKDAVLLEATKACFAPQRSGYLKRDSDPSPGVQMYEIIRNMAGGKDGGKGD